MVAGPALRRDERLLLGLLAGAAALAALALPAAALDPGRLPTQYLQASWQEELPQNTVRAMVQTREGYLWLGTQEGLARFDGHRFTNFSPGSAPGLPAGDVRALLEDRDGRLWIGTRGGGLAVYEGGVFRQVGGADGEPGGIVYALALGARGELWIGTRASGAVRLENGSFEAFGTEAGLPAERVLALLEDSRGVLWAGCGDGGLARFDGQRFHAVGTELFGTDSVLSLVEDARGRLWIGTRSSGLFVLDPAQGGGPRSAAGAGSESVMALLEDRDGNLWAGTYGRGLQRLGGGGSAAVLDTAGGLTSDNVMALLEDREGNLWVGTEGGGLNRLGEGAFRTYGTPEGLASDQVWTVLEDRQGVVWIGTEGGGLARLEAGDIRVLGEGKGLSSDSITALFEDRQGRLWVGTRGKGLNVLEDGGVRVLDRDDGLTADTVVAMAETGDGTLWLGSPRDGLLRYRDGSFGGVPEHPDLAHDLVLTLAEGPRGELLVGTNGGLKILAGDRLTVLTTADGLSNATVFSLLVDGDAVWIGTYGGGLNRLRADGRIDVFTSAQGLFNDVVLGIVDDGRGSLWMSCNKGVFRVAKADLEAVARGERETVASEVFGRADGLRSAECNGGFQPSAYRGRDGRLWFPTIQGVAAVDPEEVAPNPVPPGVVIEEVLAEGEPLPAGESFTLPPGPDRLEVAYTGISLAVPEQVRFRYRLDGYDRDWVEAGTSRRAVYTNLPGGRDYRFQVVAANEDGVWSEEGAAFAFRVEPFFYQRPAFLLLVSLGLALAAWSVYQLRVRHLVRRTEQLEAQVAQRTAEVVARRDQLEAANSELRRLNDFKSEFLGIAAHDLKNPLSVVYGYAGLIAARSGDNPGMERIAHRISASAHQMLSIVSDLLDTTAMESGRLRFEPEPTDLGALAAEVVERHRVTAAEREIELALSRCGDLSAEVDREKMSRVCDNLVSNAVRYSERGTRVEVAVAAMAGDAGEERVRLSVRDRGPGLSPAQVERIFERFERLAAKHGVAGSSTGLGLSIVKQFVEVHGGRVWVESEPGEGSTFFVEIPARAPAAGDEVSSAGS